MALGLLNWAIAEWKGDLGNVASWNDAIKAMGVSEPMECASQSHGGSVRDAWSVQSKSHGVCRAPRSVQSHSHGVRGARGVCKANATDGARPHGVCRAKGMGSVRNPWSVQSRSHGGVRSPWSVQSRSHGVQSPMECGKLERRKHSEPEAQLNVQADRRPTGSPLPPLSCGGGLTWRWAS